MAKRKVHPNKEIEEAVTYAEKKGWRYQKAGGSAHAWGKLLCPLQRREGCSMSVWSTPKNAFNHARQVRHRVTMCPHKSGIIL